MILPKLKTFNWWFVVANHPQSSFDVALLGLFSPEVYDMDTLAVVARLVKPGGKVVFRTLKESEWIEITLK